MPKFFAVRHLWANSKVGRLLQSFPRPTQQQPDQFNGEVHAESTQSKADVEAHHTWSITGVHGREEDAESGDRVRRSRCSHTQLLSWWEQGSPLRRRRPRAKITRRAVTMEEPTFPRAATAGAREVESWRNAIIQGYKIDLFDVTLHKQLLQPKNVENQTV